MKEKQLLYRLALAMVPNIGPVYAKKLLDHFGDAESIFRATPAALGKVSGVGAVRADAISSFDQFSLAEKELAFVEKYGIRCIFFTDKDYPQRLLGVRSAPILLYYKGNADLNSRRIVSVIGTRTPTEYGKRMVEQLLRELAVYGPLVISGLAYGIDGIAHAAALKHSLPTLGVLGHGLDQIYPPQHKALAREMVKHGGLITNFNTASEPASHNFPVRNQIVAGMSDALVVAETGIKGGSMLTVGDALRLKKKVFVFPGRITDKASSGCNKLIQEGNARLLLSASQLSAEMGWDPLNKPDAPPPEGREAQAAKNLSDQEKLLLRLINGKETTSVDQLSAQVQLSSTAIAMALLNLELKGLVLPLPGKMYRSAI
jgi:DNA processing protein